MISYRQFLRRVCLSCALTPATVWGADEIIQVTATRAEAVSENSERPLTPGQEARPFVELIQGTGLDGWEVHEGKESAWKRDGDIISCLSSTGGWLRSQAVYSDFVLQLEYRLQAGGNTGIGLRAPAFGNPTFTGLEIQLLDDTAEKYSDLRPDQYTGSVYYQVPATHKAKLKPLGEWNHCEIRCLGDEVTVKINGDLVNHVLLTKKKEEAEAEGAPESNYSLAQRPPLGHLALQSHSTRVDFRHIKLKNLTETTPTGLQVVDLALGSGEVVDNPQVVTMHYVGQLAGGKRFTDTRDLDQPVEIPIADVIPGLKEGLQGMKVGGRRRLIVPPHLAYGPEGVGSTIPPNATLIFEVEVLKVQQ